MTSLNAQPSELEAIAEQCVLEARRIDDLVANLRIGMARIFASWKGISADTLEEGISHQIHKMQAAQNNLEDVARNLRRAAQDASEALEQDRSQQGMRLRDGP